MSKDMTVNVYGKSAPTADAAARAAARKASRHDAAHNRREEARRENIARLQAATTTWSLRDLFEARKTA